jgi:hypothetical protein
MQHLHLTVSTKNASIVLPRETDVHASLEKYDTH